MLLLLLNFSRKGYVKTEIFDMMINWPEKKYSKGFPTISFKNGPPKKFFLSSLSHPTIHSFVHSFSGHFITRLAWHGAKLLLLFHLLQPLVQREREKKTIKKMPRMKKEKDCPFQCNLVFHLLFHSSTTKKGKEKEEEEDSDERKCPLAS